MAVLPPTTTLAAGDLAIVSYETDTTNSAASPDALRFVLLQPITSGTVIYFTDRAWTGSAFTTAAGDGTYTYTAPSNLAAGTVVTITGAQLASGGITLSTAGETIYAYQGAADAPTKFLFAADIADGNTTFNGSLVNTGLTSGVNAVAVQWDNANFAGSATEVPATELKAISTTAQWNGSDTDDNTATTGYSEVSDTTVQSPLFANADMVMIAGMAGGGQSDAILRIGNDESANVASNFTRLFRDNPDFHHVTDVSFDLENGYFFFVDSDGDATNRIMRGNVADLVSGNPNPVFTQVFATDNLDNGVDNGVTGELIVGMEINRATDKIYWIDGDLAGDFEGGWQLWSADYTGANQTLIATIDGSQNPDPSFGLAGGMGDFAVYGTGNAAYLVNSTSSVDGFGNATVTLNHILKVNLANGAVTVLPVGSDTTPGYTAGRLDPAANGQIMALDVDQRNGDIYFVTQPVSATSTAGIFKYSAGGVLTTLWTQPANNAYNTLQTFPTSNLTHIEFDEVGNRYYVSATSDTDTENDGTPLTNESDASIFVGSPTGGAPTLFVRAYEPTANGAPQGMEIDYAPTNSVVSASGTYTESTTLPNSPAGTAIGVITSATVGDVDNTVIQGATVAITGGFLSGDQLAFVNANGIAGSYNASNGVLTLTGAATLAAYQTALAAVKFTNAGDNPTLYGTDTTRTISFTTFDGLANSDPATATVTVVGINDAPVNTVGSTATVLEDSSANVVSGISISDVDADPASQNVVVTLAVSHGTLAINTAVAGGVTAGQVATNNTATVTLTGTQNAINATLAGSGLKYTPTANYNGSDSLVVTTNDQGATGTDPALTGTGTSEQDQDTKTITVTPVNDAPGGADKTITTLEDTAYTFGTADFGFTDPVDAASTSGANALGTVRFTTVPAAGQLLWDNDANTGTAAVVLKALDEVPAADITTGRLTYAPAANGNGNGYGTFTFQVRDNGGTANGGVDLDPSANTMTVDVTPVNDAPVMDLDTGTGGTGASAAYIEQAAASLLAPSGQVTDVDLQDFNGGTLTVAVTGNASSLDVLAVKNVGTGAGQIGVSGGNVTYGGTTIATMTGGSSSTPLVLTFNASADAAAVQAVVKDVTFATTGDAPSGATRTVTFTLVDGHGTVNGGADTAAATATVTVTPVNDAPSGTDNAVTTKEDTPYVFATADFGFSDATDAGANALAGVKFTTVPASGTLLLDADANPATAAVAVKAGDEVPAADITAGRLTFAPAQDANGSPYTAFTFQVRDNGGTANGGVDLDPSANTFTVNVTPVNDAPVVDLSAGAGGTGNTVTFTEDGGASAFVASDVSVTDVDSANIASATITLTNAQAGDALSVSGSLPGGIVASSYNSGTGVLTLSGSATLAQYQAALQQLRFDNNSQNPDTSDRAITVVLSDGSDSSAAATATVHVSAVNDAPLLDLDADNSSTATGANYKTLYTPNGTAVPVADSDVAITDVDNTKLASASVSITNFKTGDVLAANGTLPVGISGSYDSGTGVYTLSGSATLASYQTALHQVEFSNSGGSPDLTTRTLGIVVNDGTDNSLAATSTITLDQPPTTPTDGNAATNGVTEGAAAGALVNITAASTDPEGTTISYSLTDDAGGFFQINGATGVVSVTSKGATGIDYESASGHAYSITVAATDGVGSQSTQTFSIPVTNVAPATPTDADNATNTVSEGAGNGDAVGITASSSDVNGGTITYSLTVDAGGRFQIDSGTGKVTVADASLLDYETSKSHSITVQASDGTATTTQSFTIAVTNVAPSTPADVDGGGNGVSEAAINGASVGITASASDVHGGTITYSLTDDAGGRFAINSSTGVVTVAKASLLDYETAQSHSITVQASDGAATSSQTFSIAVANAAPSLSVDADGAAGGSVSESVANGATVGITASATDVNGGTVTYLLYDDAGGRFAIDSSTGVVTVADAAAINYETATSHTIKVQAFDGKDTTIPVAFTIAVTNVAPSTPVDGDSALDAVLEGASKGDTVGITATSSDVHGGTVTFSLTDSAGGRFQIDGSTGVVTVDNASLINYEDATSHTITVQASDGTNSSTQSFTIGVGNVSPVTPTDGDGATNSVSEGAVNGASVGITASSSDVNGGTITYSLTANAGGRFQIDGKTGVVTVADASLLNYESATSHSITVQASDGAGGTASNTFTIAVANVAPATPVDADGSTGGSVAEGAANGAAVGVTASSSDVHGGTVSYSLTSDAGGRFAIDATTGVVTVADGSLLDYESATSHSITVQASDGTDVSSQTFTIALIDVAPTAPADTDAAANEVLENAANGTAVGITASSSDVNGGAVTFSLSDNAGGRFAIDSSTGVVTVGDGTLLDRETAASHGITVRASDASGSYNETKYTIAIGDVNDNAPVITTPATATVPENTTFVTTLSSTDADITGTIPAGFKITGGADAAFFTISGNSLSFATAPNFESRQDADHNNTYLVQVTADDGVHSTNELIAVTVTNKKDTPGELGKTVDGTAGNDAIVGTKYDDHLNGGDGNDTLVGLGGKDTIDGGSGLDTAVFQGAFQAYTIVQTADGLTVSGPDGTDTLVNVERLEFANGVITPTATATDIAGAGITDGVAFDIADGGHAGEIALLGAAIFGTGILDDAHTMGLGVGYLDAGYTLEQVATLAVGTEAFGNAAGGFSNTAFVNLVYSNVTGATPDDGARAYFVGLLDSGTYTQGQLAVLAAHHELTGVRADLTGLAHTGLEYVPYAP
jgi:hypothetical protein